VAARDMRGAFGRLSRGLETNRPTSFYVFFNQTFTTFLLFSSILYLDNRRLLDDDEF
jgi:hypothetical protein